MNPLETGSVEAGNIWISSAMKSGSTHMTNIFRRLGYTLGSTHMFIDGYWNEDQDVSPQAAQYLFTMQGFVFHHHTRAIGRTVPVLANYGIRPIIPIRNVFDSLVSFIDGANVSFGIDITGGNQRVYLALHTPSWNYLDEEQKLRWAVFNMIPWYFSFYASWLDSKLPYLFVHYEKFFEDQIAGVREIINHVGAKTPVPATDEYLKDITAHKDGKFNKGVSGRGSALPGWVFDHVYAHAESWGPGYYEPIKKTLLDRR